MKKLENTSPDANSWQFLSGTNIKIAGIVLMTLDHLHQMFIVQGAPAWLNWCGRPVATMFLFLCAEGFFYTRSRKRYLLQFLGGFLFMAVMNHLLSLTMPMPDIALINNIFGTLFMAVYYMWTIDRIRGGFREKSPVRIITGIAGFLLPFLLSLIVILALRTRNWNITRIFLFIPTPLSVEGGLVLILIGVAFYLLRKYRLAQAALLAVISALTWYFSRDTPGDVQWLMVFAIIPMILYNGKRGSGGKYFFYIFTPPISTCCTAPHGF